VTPLRRLAQVWTEKHPNIVVGVVIGLLMFDTLAGAFALTTLRDQQDQIRREAATRAYNLCIVSNQARVSLRDLLMFAERRVKQTAEKTGTTPTQVADAVAFYEEAISRVKIIHCPNPDD
jgi:hypothetical protein